MKRIEYMLKNELEQLHSKALRFHNEYLNSDEPSKVHKLLKIQQQFCSEYDLEYIVKKISLDNYCLGNRNLNTFSYKIEQELRGLGSARGGASDKFIVFFSNKEQRFKSGQHYPKDVEKAFEIVKADLYKIYVAANQDKIEEIESTRFWYIIKYKIYWTYNPKHDIPVFKRDHVNLIIKKWALQCQKDDSSKRKALYSFKSNDEVFSQMTNVEFMSFIYSPYSGLGLKQEDEVEDENNTFECEDKKIEDFKGSYVKNSKQNKLVHQNRNIIRKNVDYEALNKKRRTLGKFGELLIVNDESSKLLTLGLNKTVEHSSVEIGDGLGYDIRSYDKEGNELYIEVKTTTSDRIDGFFITQNELDKARLYKDRYMLYRIYSLNRKKGTYKVEIYTYDDLVENFNLTATQYRVETK